MKLNNNETRTNPLGTDTLDFPICSRVFRTTPVSGLLIASLLAGHTISLHCSLSMDADGVYEETLESWSSKWALCDARSTVASS